MSKMSSGNMYTGFTRLCKGMAVVLVGGYIVVHIVPSAISYLALIPAKYFSFSFLVAYLPKQSVHSAVYLFLPDFCSEYI